MSNYPPEWQRAYQGQPQVGQYPNQTQQQMLYNQQQPNGSQQGNYHPQQAHHPQQPYDGQQQQYSQQQYSQQSYYNQQQLNGSQQGYYHPQQAHNPQQPYDGQQQQYGQQSYYNQQQPNDSQQGYYHLQQARNQQQPYDGQQRQYSQQQYAQQPQDSTLGRHRLQSNASAYTQGQPFGVQSNAGNPILRVLNRFTPKMIALMAGGVLSLVATAVVLATVLPGVFHAEKTNSVGISAPRGSTVYAETWMPSKVTFSHGGVEQCTYSFTYNNYGWLSSVLSVDRDGDRKTFDFSTWQEDGKPVQGRYSSQKYDVIGDYNYQYNEKGDVVTCQWGKDSFYYTYEYDSYGRISKVSLYNDDDELGATKLMEYGDDGRVFNVVYIDPEGVVQEQYATSVSYVTDDSGKIIERANRSRSSRSYVLLVEYEKVNAPVQTVDGYQLAMLLVCPQWLADFWY